MVQKKSIMTILKFKIITSSTPVYNDPINKIMINEALFGEEVCVLEKKKGWFLSILSSDNYKGWINSKDLGVLPVGNHKISTMRSFIKASPSVKSNDIHYLSLESRVHVEEIIENWAKITLSSKHSQQFGYIYYNDLRDIKQFSMDWVKTAEKFVNIPYLWGGRDTKGLDCSALVQLALQSSGVNVPRDTSSQIKSSKLYSIDRDQIERGTLVFWDGHVGIMLNKQNLLHANAFHMRTYVESLDLACIRMKGAKFYNLKK